MFQKQIVFFAFVGCALWSMGLAVGCGSTALSDDVRCEADDDCPDAAECVDGICRFGEPDRQNDGWSLDEDCPADQTRCDGRCVDVGSDPNHCGGCGIACEQYDGATTSCEGGECVYECVSPGESVQVCESAAACVDLRIDVDHCGECDRTCQSVDGADRDCVGGRCSYDCGDDTYCVDVPRDQDTGQGTCRDLQNDPEHCGQCGTVCPTATDGEAVCDGGECRIDCADGHQLCADACIDVTSDPDNCGSCGSVCPDPVNGVAICSGGDCEIDCDEGYTECNGACVNTSQDPNHCGGCGNTCPADETCFDGQCQDPPECDPSQTPFGGGNGTPGNPYRVCTAEHLQYIDDSDDYLDDHFQLAANIDLDGVDFAPLAGSDDAFGGSLNGDGFTISNLSMDTDQNYAGLFGALEADGSISDLTLADIDVAGEDFVGAVVGRSSGDISAVSVVEQNATNQIEGIEHVGGITGVNAGSIEDVSFAGEVDGELETGGIAGRSTGDITDVSVDVDAGGTDRRVGGIVGRKMGGSITDSSATGTVFGDSNTVGGIAGWISDPDVLVSGVDAELDSVEGLRFVGGITGSNSGTIEDSTASGTIEGSHQLGGLAGDNRGTIVNSSATGDVDGQTRLGGLVGQNGTGDDDTVAIIDDSTASGDVSGTDQIGGLVGRNVYDITDSTASGTVEGDESVGGLVGRSVSSGMITESKTTSQVEITGVENVGGLVGRNNGAVENSLSEAQVTGSEAVGGLVGFASNVWGDNEGAVTASRATGDVVGDDAVGGLVGETQNPTNETGVVISESSASATVQGSGQFIGGLVGDNWGLIERSFATGDINPDDQQGEEVGGLVGRSRAVSEITDCYATGDVTGQHAVGGLAGSIRDVFDFTTEVRTSHASGQVDSAGSAGGLIGENEADAPYDNVVDSYWNIATSGMDDSEGGEGLTDEQFSNQTAYEQIFDGFDFDAIWQMGADHPQLQWED